MVESNTSTTGSHRYVTLDGMRGVAALLVMWMHFTFNGPLGRVGPVVLFKVTTLAVDFFFMLSGFVLAYAYAGKLQGGMSGLTYMRQRVLRLYPMFLFGIVIGVVGAAMMMRQGMLQLPQGLFTKGLGLNLLFLPVFHDVVLPGFIGTPAEPGSIALFNGPAWSLFFEMVASASFILVARWSMRATAVLTALSFAAMTVAAWQTSHRYGYPGLSFGGGTSQSNFLIGFPRVFYGFYTGVLLYHLRERAAPWLARLPAWLFSPWFLYAVLALMLAVPFTMKGFYPALILLVLAPALVLLGARSMTMGRGTALVSHGLGWISYPLYCVHMPIGWVVSVLAVAGHWGPVTTALVAVVASLGGSTLMARFLEPPVKAVLAALWPKPARTAALP